MPSRSAPPGAAALRQGRPRADRRPRLSFDAVSFSSLVILAVLYVAGLASATSYPPVVLPPTDVKLWNNGSRPIVGNGLTPNGAPTPVLTWKCIPVCSASRMVVESIFAGADVNGNVYCAGTSLTPKTGACARYKGLTCGGRSTPVIDKAFASRPCGVFKEGSACLAMRQMLILGAQRPTCGLSVPKGPTAPGNWKCISPCGWKNTASLFVQRTADGGVQCAGPNTGACTWYQSTNCGGLPGPPVANGNGLKCASIEPNTWCSDGYQVVVAGNAAPQCGAIRGGNWKCVAPCSGNGAYSTFVSLTPSGGVTCAGPNGNTCTWYANRNCGGLPAPPASSSSGFTCAGYVFGDWCYDGRQVLTANLAAPTCLPPSSANWKCIAPCAQNGRASIFVSIGAGGGVRCSGTNGNCKWYGNNRCDGLAQPPASDASGGFGCAGYVVGDWCYDGQQVLTKSLSAPTCTVPGDWRCVPSCRDGASSSVLVHKLEDGNLQCASDVPNSCKIFSNTNCNGVYAPPANWNSNGLVCSSYNVQGWCRDAWNIIVAKKAPLGCTANQLPVRQPNKPGVAPSNNWNVVLGPYGTAPNNVDQKYSNFFHVIPDSLLPALQTWDSNSWMFIWSEAENFRSVGTSPYPEDQWTLNPRFKMFGGAQNRPGYDNGGKWFMHVQRHPARPWTLIGFYHAQDNYWPRTCAACECWKSIGIAYSYDDGLTWQDQGLIITSGDPRPADNNPKFGGNGDFGVVWDWWEKKWKMWYGGEYWLSMAVSSDPDAKPGSWVKWGGPRVGFNSPGLGGRGFPIGGHLNDDGSFNWNWFSGLARAPGANPAIHFNTYLNKWVMVWHGWDNKLYISASADSMNWEDARVIAESINQSRAWYPTIICPNGGNMWCGQSGRLYYADRWTQGSDRRDLVSRSLQFVRYD